MGHALPTVRRCKSHFRLGSNRRGGQRSFWVVAGRFCFAINIEVSPHLAHVGWKDRL